MGACRIWIVNRLIQVPVQIRDSFASAGKLCRTMDLDSKSMQNDGTHPIKQNPEGCCVAYCWGSGRHFVGEVDLATSLSYQKQFAVRLLMIEILYDLTYQNCWNDGSMFYIGQCKISITKSSST